MTEATIGHNGGPIFFDSLEDMIVATADGVRPPERITVSEAAERYHLIPGSMTGAFDYGRTPYLREPGDVLTSLDFTGMIFVGPARAGKSATFINWLCHTAINNPTDMMLVHMAQHTARHWSKNDLDKAIRNSPELRKRMVPGRRNDNIFDKKFLSGMNLEVTWPTINNLSAKTVPYTWIMDYDREPIAIDDEGDKWTLTYKRGQISKRYRMHAAETSPGFPIENPKWTPSSAHEAPPTKGLLARYNEGDRRRWYWECPQCHSSFEPHRRLLNYADSQDPMEAAESVQMICPHDGFPMKPDMQHELNIGGAWVKDGQLWVPGAREPMVGTARRSPYASFWMFGPAAGFTDWKELIYSLRSAEIDYEKTLSEEALKTVITTGFGEPFTPKSLEGLVLADVLKARAQHRAAKGEVPPGVRFMISTVDVQAGGHPSFVVHTFGIEPVQVAGGWMVDVHHVDTWKIRKSKRADGDGERKQLDPASYAEDWDVLIDEVIERTYPLSDGSGRRMRVKLVACDSGGASSATAARLNAASASGPKVSVTSNAYLFWRKLRDDPDGRRLHTRFHLLKGEPSNSKPLLIKTLPDSQQKDKFAIARGDVPVWAVNSNKAKDQTSNMLGREEAGGQVLFPVWYDEAGQEMNIDWLYAQLTTEVRETAGWRNPSRRKNEAMDLLSYLIAFFDHPDIRLQRIDWDAPPAWARDWDSNDYVTGVDGVVVAPVREVGVDLASLAGDLA